QPRPAASASATRWAQDRSALHSTRSHRSTKDKPLSQSDIAWLSPAVLRGGHVPRGSRCQFGVVIDVLHVVEIIELVEQIAQGLDDFGIDRGAVVGAPDDVGLRGRKSRRRERFFHRLEIFRRGEHDAFAIVGLYIVGAGIERGFEQLVLAAGLARVDEEFTDVLELERDRTRGAKVAAMLAQGAAYVGDGALRIVGHAVDDERDPRWAITLVADFLHLCGILAAGALERALDGVLGHVSGQRLVDAGTQARVAGRVRAAAARGDGDLADQLGEKFSATRVLGVLATFDAGASAHTDSCVVREKTAILAVWRRRRKGSVLARVLP